MIGFATACLISGFTIGLLIPTVLAVAITSFQLLLVVVGLWISDQIFAGQLFLWAFVGISLHQAAYLAAAAWRTSRTTKSGVRLKVEIENEFDLMESLVRRIEARAPEVESEAATLAVLARKMRQVFVSEDLLTMLLLESRRQN